MKKTLIAVAAMAALATVLSIGMSSCKKTVNYDDVNDCVVRTDADQTGYIPLEDYDALALNYAAQMAEENSDRSENDTTGWYSYFASLYTDNGLSVPRVGEKSINLPVQVSVYLDNTASMKGYLNPTKGSTTALTDILNGIRINYADVDKDHESAYYIDKSGMKRTTLDSLITNINGKKVPSSDAYPMNGFFENIVEKFDTDTTTSNIFFFLTDAIPSGTNEQIKANREFNVEQKTTLTTDITSIFAKLENKDFGVSIYQFNVNFSGDYIDYRNGTQKNVSGNRPIYMLVMGNSALVREFKDKVDAGEIKNFVPMNAAHSINRYNSNVRVVVSGGNSGNAEFDEGDQEYKLQEDDKSVTINVPLEAIPGYLLDEKDLSNEGSELAITVKKDDADITQGLRNGQMKIADNSLILSSLPINGEHTFEISFDNVMPGWIITSSSASDLDVKNNMSGTFNLDVIAEGIFSGLNGVTGKSMGKPIVVKVEK